MKNLIFFCTLILISFTAFAETEYYLGQNCIGSPIKDIHRKVPNEEVPYEKVLISLNKNSNSEITFFNAINLSNEWSVGYVISSSKYLEYPVKSQVLVSPVQDTSFYDYKRWFYQKEQPGETVGRYGIFDEDAWVTYDLRMLQMITDQKGAKRLEFYYVTLKNRTHIRCEVLNPVNPVQVPKLVNDSIEKFHGRQRYVGDQEFMVLWGIDYDLESFYDEAEIQLESLVYGKFKATRPISEDNTDTYYGYNRDSREPSYLRIRPSI